jgi:uncharacterized protein
MLLAAVVAFAGAAVQSATGFGFALILSPALLAVLDPYEAISAVLVLGLVLNLLVLFDGGRLGPVRWQTLTPLLTAALPGLALGVLALDLLSKAVLQALVGAVVIVAAGERLLAERGGRPEPRGGVPSAAAVGLLSGALTTSISVSGPPIVLWLERRGLAAAELRATLAAAFLGLNVTGGIALLVVGGLGRWAPAGDLLLLLGVVLVGHFAGRHAFHMLDERRFSIAVLVLIVVTGVASLAAGLAGM